MKPVRLWGLESVAQEVEAALDALDSNELRALAREMLQALGDASRSRFANSLLSQAARKGKGGPPSAKSALDVAEVSSFVAAAIRVGQADPSDVDARLRLGSLAFVRKDYAAARGILGDLIRMLESGDVYLGEDELVEDVLAVDLGVCTAQYLVAVYMTTGAQNRAKAIREALEVFAVLDHFTEPIGRMEQVAVEPLPELKAFLPQWRSILGKEAVATLTRARFASSRDVDSWLREVTLRVEGAEGLAELARSSRHPNDYRAWCANLVATNDWKGTLAAYEEAAENVHDRDGRARGAFRDGAALAAQELGKRDLSPWLERAWREDSSLVRLRRWLGAARSQASLRKRVAAALEACPKARQRQRGLLLVLNREYAEAARMLASASSLGWSDADHPGHLLFTVFHDLLIEGDSTRKAHKASAQLTATSSANAFSEYFVPPPRPDEPHLAIPEIADILKVAGIQRLSDSATRATVVGAMRKATEKRLAAIIENKRRRYYEQVAVLVAACLGCDPSTEARAWVETLQARYKRHRALQAELQRYLPVHD